ncbi:MAG TPA: hypothetical protein VF062_15285 [Candidatus Limnocylindrales bacterium]
MDDERALIAELTELALTTAAPDELLVFEETAHEYFADPQAALTAAQKDNAVGFGLELAMITPVALAVGTAVAQAILAAVGERVVAASGRGATALLKRLLRKGPQPQGWQQGAYPQGSQPQVPQQGAYPQGSQPQPQGPQQRPDDLALSPQQARYVRQVALDRARALGMPEGQANLLADSFVGAIVTTG